MQRSLLFDRAVPAPKGRDIIELLKPVTWFPPMWAFLCGVVSSGAAFESRWLLLIAGIALAGPFVCGTSQAVNDWFDRHVDAINEPDRPIPSGRIAGRWGLAIAILGSIASLALAALLGPLVVAATILGLVLAWAYSAPPFRLKTNGWVGPAAVGFSYEGLAWFTGAAVMLGAMPSATVLGLIIVYSLGAHGIMTLNDFKAVEGDRQLGLKSLPVMLGERRAAIVACAVMAMAQVAAIAILLTATHALSAALVGIALAIQLALMPRLIREPEARAPWYNATGVSLYVLGMLAAALGTGGWIG